MTVAGAVSAAARFPAFCCSCHQRPAALLFISARPTALGSHGNPTKSYACVCGSNLRPGPGPALGLGLSLVSPWSGLKRFGVPSRQSYGRREKKGKCRGKVVYASLFGVGAPEALVIGVVALLVFGPKGLAEVARNLGKTLRAFQPTIRELQEVSREFKNTLEREIGLDEAASSTNPTYKPNSFVNENQQATVDPNGMPKPESYSSTDLFQRQLIADALRSETESSNPDEQKQEVVTASEVATTTSEASEVAAPTTEASEVAAASREEASEVAATTPEVASAPEVAPQMPVPVQAENER